MCLPFDNKQPNTFQGKSSVFQLQLIAFIQLALLFARQIVHFDLSELYEIFFIVVLWSGWSSLGSFQCFIYIIYTLYQIILKGIYFATRFQNEVPIFGEEGREKVHSILTFITLIFYVIAQYFTFIAYREFSALEIEQDYTIENAERRERTQLQQKNNQNQRSNQAFYGRGIAIG